MCKVSILMPVFNAEKYLAEAIDSLVCQTFEDWELLILNDGSTDLSKSIIEGQADTRIRYIENEGNLGLIATLNKGIALCKGEYIARMDADDVAHSDRLKSQVGYMNRNADCVMCGTNATVIDENGKEIGKIVNPTQDEYLQISLLFTNPFIHPSMMMRRSALLNLRFDEKAIHVEDFELWTRMASKGKIANLSRPLLKYRWHNANVSNTNRERQERSKNEIIRLQLEKLGVEASDADLDIHRLTFNLYSLGRAMDIETNKSEAVGDWFELLTKQNRCKRLFLVADFEAFLWSRWIVLFLSQGKIAKALLPKFITPTPSILYKTILLIAYLRKK